jgi:hypothetical protein
MRCVCLVMRQNNRCHDLERSKTAVTSFKVCGDGWDPEARLEVAAVAEAFRQQRAAQFTVKVAPDPAQVGLFSHVSIMLRCRWVKCGRYRRRAFSTSSEFSHLIGGCHATLARVVPAR